MDVKITSGHLDLIASGTVRTAFENSIKFDFGEIWLKLIFHESKEEGKIEYEVAENKLGMTCQVYVKGSLHGIAEPVELGTLEDRRFYFSFEVNRPSTSHDLWVLNYSFYHGESIDG